MATRAKAKTPSKPKLGRPTEFRRDIANRICDGIADGKSLRTVCKSQGMPSRTTVFRWLASQPSFRSQYACAREDQAEALADDVLDTSQDKNLDPNDRRVRVDALKWLAGKLKPKVYGDTTKHELTGKNGGPIETVVRPDLSDLDPDERDVIRAILVARAAESERGPA